jgi:virginiamycin B lyase
MARTVARPESRAYGRAVAVGAVASAAALVAVLLSALLGARDHPEQAAAAPFPPSQAVPVTVDRLQRVVGGGVIGWRLPVPYAGPRDVAVTASAVWITEQNKGAVDAFVDGKLIRYEVDAKFPNSGAFALTPGPSGSVWFTGYPNGNIGRLLPDGTVNSFSPIVDTAGTVAAVEDQIGSMWVTDVNLGVVLRIDQQGQLSAFPVPPPTSTREPVGPYDIAGTPDGAIWFTDPRTRSIGEISGSAGTPLIVEHRVRQGSVPRSIAAGPDGSLWVTLPKTGIGRVDPSGSLQTVAVRTGSDDINNLAIAKDGTVWLTTTGRSILHVRPDGSLIRRVVMPGGAAGADGIAIGPDGTVWAAATDVNLLVEIPRHRTT